VSQVFIHGVEAMQIILEDGVCPCTVELEQHLSTAPGYRLYTKYN